MPRLTRDLPNAQPVDGAGRSVGPPTTLVAGSECAITIRKLRKSDDPFEEWWSEIRVGDQLYRVPLRLLDLTNAA